MAVHLSEHFTYKKLLKAVMPSIFMMVFTSIYTIVDGIFVSNFVGKTAFASVNLVYPIIMAIGAIGFMLGAGGSALIAKTLGEGDNERANKFFSMIIYFTMIIGVIVSIGGIFLIRPFSKLLGATPDMLENCVLYGSILMGANIIYMLQNVFQSVFVAAEKPMLGFIMIVCAGVTNIILDAVLVAGLKLGLVGAAVATATSYLIGGMLPIIYFARKNKSLLRLVKTKFEFKPLGQACLNGSSELVTNISSSIISMLFNMQLLKIAGENGVAAYGVIMYAGFIFAAVFIGYSIGTAPIIGYHYGAENSSELKNILKKSIILIFSTGVLMTSLVEALSNPLASIFVSYDTELLKMTANGFRLYSIAFLVFGFNIFCSSFFTSLNNGLISAIISFARTLLFQIIAIFVFPIILGLNGIWLSVVFAEAMALIVSIICLIANKKKYKY